MSIITLTTGWKDDFYVAALKGVLLSGVPSAQIVDVTHNSPAFSTGISYSAYMVRQSYSFFPKGSIHIISALSEYCEGSPFAAAYHNGHYFVGSDNGFFGLLFDTSEPDAMVHIEKFTDYESPNYPAISVFAPAAIHLANGGDIAELGDSYTDYNRKGAILATIDEAQIIGTIIYINAFGNVITNITRNDFDRIGKGRPFEIMVQRTGSKIKRINKYFHETRQGDLLAVFNISGYLEIAQNKGSIVNMLNLSLNSNVIIKFFINHSK